MVFTTQGGGGISKEEGSFSHLHKCIGKQHAISHVSPSEGKKIPNTQIKAYFLTIEEYTPLSQHLQRF